MKIKTMIALTTAAAGELTTPSAAQCQQYYNNIGMTHCVPTQTRLPVYFNAASLSGTTYNVNHLRESLIHAVDVWNEESQSRTLLYYAGDGVVPPGQAYGITVTHDTTTSHCAFRPQAIAYAQGSGGLAHRLTPRPWGVITPPA